MTKTFFHDVASLILDDVGKITKVAVNYFYQDKNWLEIVRWAKKYVYLFEMFDTGTVDWNNVYKNPHLLHFY